MAFPKMLTDGLGNLMRPELGYYAKITTGTYTGDGAVSQSITGLGFAPRFIIILQQSDGTDNIQSNNFVGLDVLFTGMGMNWTDGVTNYRDDRLISLDVDGFTVDDDGGDQPPNKNGEVYIFIALG